MSSLSAAPTNLRLARLAGVLLAAIQWGRFSDERYVIDDAWISFRTARNLVEAGGLTFDLTQPPVEGVTNLLWTLLSALGQWVAPAADPAVVARTVGGLCLLGVVWLATGLTARWADRPVVGALFTSLALGGAGSLAFHSLSGLESGFYLLLWVATLEVVEGAGPAPISRARGASLAGLLIALGMTRPEGVLLGGLTFLFALTRWGPAGRGRAIAAAGAWACGIAALEAFRLLYFGALVPNTFHAKPPNLEGGWGYLLRFCQATGWVGALGLVAAMRTRAVGWLAGIAVVMLAGAVWSGGDWMPGFRRAMDVYVIIAIGAGVAVGSREAWRRRAGAVGAGALALGSLWMAVTGLDAGRYGQVVYGQVGSLLARTPEVDTVAAADVGHLGWCFPGSILDLGGLTDARWAASGGWDEAWFRERDPDVLLVVTGSPLQPDLVETAGVRAYEARALQYVRESGRYRLRAVIPLPGLTQMAVIARDGVEMPDAIWGEAPTR
ncbi:MAG: hypothetical protein EXR69_00215 [Myxococcales bacterium]|nr:hypothetical protein [Myxococcales bacterium]